MSSPSSRIFWKGLYLILCLNVFGLLADFKSDGRLFHIFQSQVVIKKGETWASPAPRVWPAQRFSL